jgi:hypothetical protein
VAVEQQIGGPLPLRENLVVGLWQTLVEDALQIKRRKAGVVLPVLEVISRRLKRQACSSQGCRCQRRQQTPK